MSISFSSCADLRVYELIYTARTPSVYMIYRETSRQQLLAFQIIRYLLKI